MDKTVAKDWVDLLRSGTVKQGKYQLRDLDDHCDPVGVLCMLAEEAGVIVGKKRTKPESEVFFGWDYDHTATRIPEAVSKWSGLGYWAANRIITMNDHGKKFDEIADFIESKYIKEEKNV